MAMRPYAIQSADCILDMKLIASMFAAPVFLLGGACLFLGSRTV
jgi:hypothetical protein